MPQNLTQSVNIGYDHLWEAGSNGNNALYIDSQGTGALLLQDNGGTGNVGIGTGTPSAKLYVNGTAGGTSAWTNFSDARLKTNVAPLAGALAAVLRLQGVTYSFIAPKNRTLGKDLNLPDAPQVGFLAQDVAKVVPQAVVTPADPATGVYSLMESKLIPYLVEAIKTQQAQIARQEARIAELEARVAAMKPAP